MFQVFDPDNSGSVVPTELLVAFSMSMKGSVTDKLRCEKTFYNYMIITEFADGPSSCMTETAVGKLIQRKWKTYLRSCAK